MSPVPYFIPFHSIHFFLFYQIVVLKYNICFVSRRLFDGKVVIPCKTKIVYCTIRRSWKEKSTIQVDMEATVENGKCNYK